MKTIDSAKKAQQRVGSLSACAHRACRLCIVTLASIGVQCAPVGRDTWPRDRLDGPGDDPPTPPAWAHIGDAIGCRIERLSNPESKKLFRWTSCGGEGCEEAALGEDDFLPGHEWLGTASGALASSAGETLTLQANVPTKDGASIERVAWIADGEGLLTDGFRATAQGSTPIECGVQQIATSEGTVALLVYALVDIKDPNQPVSNFVNVAISKGSNAVQMSPVDLVQLGARPRTSIRLGDTRLFWYSEGSDITAFSLQGPDFGGVLLGHADEDSQDILALSALASTGDRIFFSEYYQDCGPGRCWHWRVMTSDSASPPSELIPATDDYDVTLPVVAGSYIAWQRLFPAPPGGSTPYEKSEIWASPIAATAGDVQPFKITTLAYATLRDDTVVAGADHIAALDHLEIGPSISIWNLTTGTHVSRKLPDTDYAEKLLGITENHLYVLGRAGGSPDVYQRIYRLRID